MWLYYRKFLRVSNPVWLTALVYLGIHARFLLLTPRAWLSGLEHP
jgi:hypothetical protein